MLATPTPLSVSVSVSFSAVRGRSDKTGASSRRLNRSPVNAGERPRPKSSRSPPQLESVRPRATSLGRRAPLRGAVRLPQGTCTRPSCTGPHDGRNRGERRGSYAVQVWSTHAEGHSVPAAGDGRCVAMQPAPGRVVVVHHREAQGSRTQGKDTQASEVTPAGVR